MCFIPNNSPSDHPLWVLCIIFPSEPGGPRQPLCFYELIYVQTYHQDEVRMIYIFTIPAAQAKKFPSDSFIYKLTSLLLFFVVK